MDTISAHHTLQTFRQELYQSPGHRRDALFELLEAVLVAPVRSTLVRLSLTPVFRRRWPSACDALADGQLSPAACRRLLHQVVPEPPAPGRPLWAGDGTAWPRPAAKTSPERTYGHFASPGVPRDSLIVGWEYEWLFAVPLVGSSWVLPLDQARRAPGAGTPTEVAVRQLRGAAAARPPGAARPVALYDSGYDPVTFVRAELPLDVLARLRTRRKVFGPPGPYGGRGPRPKHGHEFKLWDSRTHPAPARSAPQEDPVHGWVQVDVWPDQHVQGTHEAPCTVVRVQVERLPRHAKPPQPLWLAWIGGELPEDLLELWRWYSARFTAVHGFRFLKQDPGWTSVRPCDPEAADRWSWLLLLALWELWLGRDLVADQRLPWERPLPPERLTPGRVRRALAPELSRLGTPVRPVRPRGKAPGRRPGDCPGPRTRYPVVRRHPPRSKKAKTGGLTPTPLIPFVQTPMPERQRRITEWQTTLPEPDIIRADRVGSLAAPSLRTVRADLPHTALQSVVHLIGIGQPALGPLDG
ncbi:MAG: transposase, partial [Chloroflexi bacterium]|nr:transposase [Chloroflexota bacterium]